MQAGALDLGRPWLPSQRPEPAWATNFASVRDACANGKRRLGPGPRATTALVLSALNHAVCLGEVRAGRVIRHSVEGQYIALRFT